ncbi:hypothetical protein LSM04_008210 [Trypanosoma melophagium]|uniref:uncharacterized protein n=1 Tax=Trypanosoma melophagium TaxID=715481 RepID=UPI003519FF7D|nr:hypothetical protein LSM04_008210 [Trypanosoma melophagium]
MDALVSKAVERLGRKKVWLVVHVVQQLDASNRTVSGVREALRRIHLYLDDEEFAALTRLFARDGDVTNGNTHFDTLAFSRAFLTTLSPRRQHILRLVLRKVDPSSSGFVSFATLCELYDTMRHPHALTQRKPDALLREFLNDFAEINPNISSSSSNNNNNNGNDVGSGNVGITTEELAAYYVGISRTTTRDEDFELRCIRSFSLDRPKRNVLEDFEYDESSRDASHRSSRRRKSTNVVTGAAVHPLYRTTAMEYGKECEKATYDGKYSLNHCFTKYAPMQRGGGATSMNM